MKVGSQYDTGAGTAVLGVIALSFSFSIIAIIVFEKLIRKTLHTFTLVSSVEVPDTFYFACGICSS